jgi:hypothetical protein
MKAKNNRETDDQVIVIEDLSAEHAEAIQGGNRDPEPISGREVKILLNSTY